MICRGTARWGQRGHSAMFDHFMNGLVYMHENNKEPEDLAQDWRQYIMIRMMEIIQEQQTGFIPIITAHTQEPADEQLLPQLSTIMDIKEDELPNYFVLHSMTDQLVPYPHPPHSDDDLEKLTPELVILWARRTVILLEIEEFEKEIAELEKKKVDDADNFTEEN